MIDPRRYLSTFAIVSLVLLRLVIGWHFFREGAQKVEYDRHDGELRMATTFSSEGFLTQAKGPLAKLFHSQAPDDHGYRELLAVQRPNVPPSEEDAAEPAAPYHDWAERIAGDWRAIRDRAKEVPGLTDEQRQRVDEIYAERTEQLSNYLASEAAAITEYQHELWRLNNWQNAPEAGDVPFYDERIATKAVETASQPMAWVSQVRQLEADYLSDLRAVLTTEQRADPTASSTFNDALTSDKQAWLNTVNVAVTVLTIGVGACLLLGFLTRLASVVGALFLLAVIASQPPWLAESLPTMNQIIEFAGLLVLAGTGAGRWAGLDFFIYALFNRDRDAEA